MCQFCSAPVWLKMWVHTLFFQDEWQKKCPLTLFCFSWLVVQSQKKKKKKNSSQKSENMDTGFLEYWQKYFGVGRSAFISWLIILWCVEQWLWHFVWKELQMYQCMFYSRPAAVELTLISWSWKIKKEKKLRPSECEQLRLRQHMILWN